MALLGRISAVLTANTQDFTRPLNEATAELRRFAQQARGLSFNLDDRALNRTLTRTQDFQRRVQEIRAALARGVGLGLPDPDRLLDKFRAFEDVGRPLTDVKNKVEQLSLAVQAELLPALSELQRDWDTLYRQIDSGATTFDGATGRINRLRDGVVALGRAVSSAQDLGKLASTLNANNTGASFFQPRAKEALQRSIELRDSAQKIPQRFRNNDAFADISVQAERNAEEIERAASRVAAAQLRIAREGRETPDNLLNRGRAQQELDDLVRRQRAINAAFSRQITSAQIREIISPEAERQVDSLTEKFGKLVARLREGGDTRFDGLIARVGGVLEQLNRAEVSAKKAKVAIEALAAADFDKSFGDKGFKDANDKLKTDSERAIEEIRKNFASQRKNIIGGVGNLRLIGPDRARAIGEVNTREDIALARENFNSSVVERVSSLGEKAKKLGDAGIQSQFEDIRKLSQDANSSLKAAFDARDPLAAGQALDNYRAKLDALNKSVSAFERRIASAETAQKRFSQFLSISGSRSDKLGSSLTRFATDIAATRQLAGNLPAQNERGREAIERRIEKDIAFAEKAARIQQRLADSDRLSDDRRARLRSRVDDAIARRREESVGVLVDNSDGTITRRRARAVMDRFARNQGSFGVAGIATAQLALQQGLFAIDDFMSATGGLEYKLRAVGNNITQLGLLLGQSGLIPGLNATTGLFIGLAAVLGGQVASAFARSIGDSESLQQKLSALNSALKSSESNAKQLAAAYEELANSIREAGQSEIGRQNASLEKTVSELSRLRKDAATETAASLDPDIAALRARRGADQKQLEGSSSIPERVRLQRRIDRSREEEQRVLSRLSSQADGGEISRSLQSAARDAVTLAEGARLALNNPFGGGASPEAIKAADAQVKSTVDALFKSQAIGAFDASDPAAAAKALAAIRQQLDALQDLRESAGTTGLAGIEETVDNLIERLLKDASRLQARLSGAFDQIDASLTRTATFASRTLGRAQERIADAFEGDSSSSAIRAELDRLADALSQVRALASRAGTPAEAAAYQADIAAIQDHARALLEAAGNLQLLSDSLRVARDSISSDAAAMQQRADDARRADIRNPTQQTQEARERAERDADKARGIERKFQDDMATARERTEQRLLRQQDENARRRAEIDRQLAVPAGETSEDGVRGGTVDERAQLREERRRLEEDARRATENSPEASQARRDRDRATADLERAQSADRGRVLAMSPAERAGKELAQNLRDVNEEFRQRGEDPREVNRRLINEAMRSTAPAIFNMADEVQNAVLQGPSRAALQASDITTSQGASELNRLLRGDDSARNQNLVELQKQSQNLQRLVQIAEQNGAPPGVFDN